MLRARRSAQHRKYLLCCDDKNRAIAVVNIEIVVADVMVVVVVAVVVVIVMVAVAQDRTAFVLAHEGEMEGSEAEKRGGEMICQAAHLAITHE